MQQVEGADLSPRVTTRMYAGGQQRTRVDNQRTRGTNECTRVAPNIHGGKQPSTATYARAAEGDLGDLIGRQVDEGDRNLMRPHEDVGDGLAQKSIQPVGQPYVRAWAFALC